MVGSVSVLGLAPSVEVMIVPGFVALGGIACMVFLCREGCGHLQQP
jgi:hypothetical protein